MSRPLSGAQPDQLCITNVTWSPAPERDVRRGLLGWTSCHFGDLIRIDGIAIRRTRDGRLVLSFPARRDRHGNDHPVVSPIGDQARIQLEGAILSALHGHLRETAL